MNKILTTETQIAVLPERDIVSDAGSDDVESAGEASSFVMPLGTSPSDELSNLVLETSFLDVGEVLVARLRTAVSQSKNADRCTFTMDG